MDADVRALKQIADWLSVAGLAVASFGAAMALCLSGCGGSSTSIASNQTAAPAFSPGGGNYTSAQTVKITSATSGAVLYCTTDGTTPTTKSPQCSSPTTVLKSEYLQAIAVAPNMNASSVFAAGYTINLNATDAPTFLPAGGTYDTTQQVTISAATGANIYYCVTAGCTPTASSTLYTGPVTVSSTETLSAIAIVSGYDNSAIATATYTLDAIAAPVFSLASGTYKKAQTVAIKPGDSKSVTIYYAISANSSGTTPSSISNVYTGTINVAQTETISAIAMDANGKSSPVTTVAYAIGASQAVAAPTFSPASGSTITADQPVTIADGDSEALIYYTADGTPPTTASSAYSSGTPLTFSTPGDVTIWAFAIDTGVSSVLSSATYHVNAISRPALSLANGSIVMQGQTVTIASGDAYVPVYYTIDGSAPTKSSPTYTSGSLITLSTVGDITIKARAIARDGVTTSAEVDATYHVGASGPQFSGTVLSGTNKISGAKVQLYAAGTSGYGSAGTALGDAAITGSDGSFRIDNYPCAPAPNDQFYLVATGGDTGSGANDKIVLMSAPGACSSLTSNSTFTVNEVTTIASSYALSAFAKIDSNGGIDIGTPATYNATIELGATATHAATNATASSCNAGGNWQSTGAETCNYTGLKNAFKAANNLVNLTTGAARSWTPDYSTNLAGDTNILNNSTVPTTRINALADMLATCVASDGSGCASGLFAGATTGAATTTNTPNVPNITPKDTLQAALNIAQNPGNNVSTLLGLVSSMTAPPYSLIDVTTSKTLALTGSSTSAPTDLTLAITYTGAGLGIKPELTLSDGVAKIYNSSLAIDAKGYIWVAAFSGVTALQTQGNILAGFDNLGAPLTPATVLSTDSNPVPTYGGFNPNPSNMSEGLYAIAIDQSGNLWLGDKEQGHVFKVNPASLTLPLPFDSAYGRGIYAMAFDSSNNLWMTAGSDMAEYQDDGTILQQNLNGLNTNGVSFKTLSGLTFASDDSLWGADSQALDVYQIDSTGVISSDLYPGGTAYAASPALVAGRDGNVYGCGDSGGTTLDVFNSGAIKSQIPFTQTGTRGCGSQLVLDGQERLFAISSHNPKKWKVIDEFTTAGVLISPATGYSGTSTGDGTSQSGEVLTINYDSSANKPVQGTAAMDGSGNLWVLNTDAGKTTSAQGNVLVEYVGIGAPVVTPTSVALKNGNLGVRP